MSASLLPSGRGLVRHVRDQEQLLFDLSLHLGQLGLERLHLVGERLQLLSARAERGLVALARELRHRLARGVALGLESLGLLHELTPANRELGYRVELRRVLTRAPRQLCADFVEVFGDMACVEHGGA